jgi:hypothetical protein
MTVLVILNAFMIDGTHLSGLTWGKVNSVYFDCYIYRYYRWDPHVNIYLLPYMWV